MSDSTTTFAVKKAFFFHPACLLSLFFLLLPSTAESQTACAEATSFTTLKANNVGAGLLNGGDLWWDLSNTRYLVPDTFPVPVGSIFTGALWIGGIDDFGQLRIAAQTYRQGGNDFWPGPIDQTTGDVAGGDCAPFDRHWTVERADIYTHQMFSAPIDTIDIPEGILSWPAIGNPYAKGAAGIALTLTEELAPFTDVDGDGLYDPTLGDYPNVPGDQAVFWVFNDIGNVHTETGGEALGLEIRALAYAYASAQPAINNATFYHYELVNKQGYALDSVYIGHFVDVDIGAFDDDFVGCDTARNLGIGFNGDAVDGPTSSNYGTKPPMVALDLLKGPQTSQGASTRTEMTSFLSYRNDFNPISGNPEVAVHYWRYLKARWKDNSPLTHGGNGYGGTTPFSYNFTDLPSLPLPAWSECSIGNTPFDRRFVLSTGPVQMAAGYQSTIDYAVIWTPQESQSGCAADFSLLFADEAVVQAFFDAEICTGAYTDNLSLGLFSANSELIRLNLRPNPATNFSVVSWTSAEGMQPGKTVDIVLRDMFGRRTFLGQTRNGAPGEPSEYKIETSSLSKGIYLLTIEQSGKVIGADKLVK